MDKSGVKNYDVIIVGAGICGVTFLKYARDKGLNCLILEKQNDVGGLWKWLPKWQDLQNRTNDFAINGLPIHGDKQSDVHQYVKDWVKKYNLEDYIRLDCEVRGSSWNEDHWQLETTDGTFYARYMIAASGVQNIPWKPSIDRSNSSLIEYHSSGIKQPEKLSGKIVTVIGGGASSFDLLNLAIKYDAQKINWVYRSTKWFLPSTKSKQDNKLNDLRLLSRLQCAMPSLDKINKVFGKMINKKYSYFKLQDIKPDKPIDMYKDQVIPGRSLMIQHFDSINRYQGEIQTINEKSIILKNGQSLESDVLLWGTGYKINLSYLNLPEYNNITELKDLYPRLGSLVRSLDYPNLFFLGMSLIESTTATPFFTAIESKSIVAHILGKCEIPRKNIPHHVVHWNLIKFFGNFYHAPTIRIFWKLKYFLMPWWYSLFPRKQIKI
jgi:cation diffusion facilitator CzcD-associated flavoprotein CzcO